MNAAFKGQRVELLKVLSKIFGIIYLTYPVQSKRRDRPWIYRNPWAMVWACGVGLLAYNLTLNLLAVLGWAAATCAAWASAHARERDAPRDH